MFNFTKITLASAPHAEVRMQSIQHNDRQSPPGGFLGLLHSRSPPVQQCPFATDHAQTCANAGVGVKNARKTGREKWEQRRPEYAGTGHI
jgi:hypothetical protein